ncbi:hypothetical protein ACOMHN_009508 [Nucella lapillus]
MISRANRHSKRWLLNNNTTNNNAVSKDIRYRIVILGAAGVGKSTNISQYLYDCGPDAMLAVSLATVHPVTNTVRFSAIMDVHEVAYDVQGRRLILELLEARIDAAQDDNWWVGIPRGDAYIIVYSVTDDASLDAISTVRKELVKQHSYLHVPIVIVANKMDADDGSRHEQNVITELTATLEWEHGFAATSAATDPNSLSSIFLQIFRQVEFSPDHEMKAWLELHKDLSRPKNRDTLFNRLSRTIKKLMCGPQ